MARVSRSADRGTTLRLPKSREAIWQSFGDDPTKEFVAAPLPFGNGGGYDNLGDHNTMSTRRRTGARTEDAACPC